MDKKSIACIMVNMQESRHVATQDQVPAPSVEQLSIIPSQRSSIEDAPEFSQLPEDGSVSPVQTESTQRYQREAIGRLAAYLIERYQNYPGSGTPPPRITPTSRPR